MMKDDDAFRSVEELERENRALKRRLGLAELSLARAKQISITQERVENVITAGFKKELQFFKLVLENTTSILLLFDVDGRFAYASQIFLTEAGIANFGLINGRQYNEVLNQIISKACLSRFDKAVKSAIAKKSTVTIEERINFSGKTVKTFSILITSMTDDGGQSTGIMALFNDITEINNALESAKRANAAKSNFLANMSHEIRTPLNAIVGMATIAQSSTDMEKIRYCLDKINDSSSHLLGVINDILDMSKIETNHFELSYSEFVFEKMLLRIIDVMRFKIEEKGIEFVLNCDPSIPYAIYSDEQRLAQVIMNLLSNAVKFTPNGGKIEIKVETESFKGDDYTLKFSIKDSGIGISDEQKPRLFKVFSQADSSISRKFGGTGLGLVISKNIIAMLGGDIWFDSKIGQGTTFTFNMRTRARLLTPVAKFNRSDIRILAVDDMPEVCMSFSLYAKKLGIECSVADNADKALKIIRDKHHDFIFVDWKMPQTDGLELVREIKKLTNEKTVIVMISAADWTDIDAQAKQLGISEFISKPILLPVIENILDKYCNRSSISGAKQTDNFEGKTILLVDDIEINREIIISLLENTGINIICAENGIEAVNKYIANRSIIDLVFMDVQMPEMDGYEATRRIRNIEGDNPLVTPIVAMTANVFKEDIERCLASGMNDHIGKPINAPEILAKMKRWTK